MELFDVYPLLDIEPVKGSGSYIFDRHGNKYLDLYGGHAVISIGHSHPHYLKRLNEQANQLGFYSNSVQVPQQKLLANLLGKISGCEQYKLFLCNSGAEANENALKLASFHTNKSKIIAFKGAFHGRTSAAVAVTDNPKYKAPINQTNEVVFLPLNNIELVRENLKNQDVAAVIIEGIQGVSGIYVPENSFLKELSKLCREYGAILILDEVQSGYGRSGLFFAHQSAGIYPDLITVAKGMGNGFPIAAVLISKQFEAIHGMLGTTFGGNHLACAAGMAVLEVMEQEKLMSNVLSIGNYLLDELKNFPCIKDVRGRGLMIGLELEIPAGPVRNSILNEYKIFTGSSSQPNTLRLLPALNIGKAEIDYFLSSLEKILSKQ